MFSINRDKLVRTEQYDSIPKTTGHENCNTYNNPEFSACATPTPYQRSFTHNKNYEEIEEKPAGIHSDEPEVPAEYISSDDDENYLCLNVDSPKSEEEKPFSETNEKMQNLINSHSGIPESYCEGLSNAKIISAPEDECGLDNVCGLGQVKETLLNIFIYPAIFPHLFPRKIRWNQILLYGPPGTGKTMLAKAISTEINATLYRISSADLLSHWQGESEKQIRNLFEEVRSNAEPTVLFFDEIDGLCRKRTSAEDDSVRRIKTQLLTQFDDFAYDSEYNQAYIIGATNCPWEIDSGFMRRFHKKIFVPLPDMKARLEILKKSFENIETDLVESEWNEIGNKTEGYSGSDLVNLVMTSCCERFMQMKKCKYWEAKGDLWVPASSSSLFLTRMNFQDIPQDKVGSRKIIFTDLKAAIANTPKSVGSEEMARYLEFSSKTK